MAKILYNCFKKAVSIFCRPPEWIRNVQMIQVLVQDLDENVDENVLNCKVVKKAATPPFLHQLPFQVYPPFLEKKFIPSQVAQFLEGPTPL